MSEDGDYWYATTFDDLLQAKISHTLDLQNFKLDGVRESLNQCLSLITRIADLALDDIDGDVSSVEILRLIRPVVAKVENRLALIDEHRESMIPHFEMIDRLVKEELERQRLKRERGE